ncbi:MAG: peroxiredoxin family protein [Anaerolineae bacterium]
MLASRIPVGAAEAATREPAPRVGHVAPDLSLPTPDGETITLSDLRGQVVLLNFWATWCPPCRAEMPALQDAYDRFRDEGFVVLGVDQFELPGQVTGFTDRFGITYPQVIDETGQTSRAYGVFRIPASFFIDREGVIQKVVPGPLNLPQIAAEVSALLGT